VKVLRLVTLGKSDSEIAEELVISLNTVACHVSRILNKTNSANRSEVGAFTIRHGHSPTITSPRHPQLYDGLVFRLPVPLRAKYNRAITGLRLSRPSMTLMWRVYAAHW
jgi:DNA-binding CsgD family transcriptional regulator